MFAGDALQLCELTKHLDLDLIIKLLNYLDICILLKFRSIKRKRLEIACYVHVCAVQDVTHTVHDVWSLIQGINHKLIIAIGCSCNFAGPFILSGPLWFQSFWVRTASSLTALKRGLPYFSQSGIISKVANLEITISVKACSTVSNWLHLFFI